MDAGLVRNPVGGFWQTYEANWCDDDGILALAYKDNFKQFNATKGSC